MPCQYVGIWERKYIFRPSLGPMLNTHLKDIYESHYHDWNSNLNWLKALEKDAATAYKVPCMKYISIGTQRD